MSGQIKQYVFKKSAAKRIPVSGTFELTPRCNLNCKMCYVHMSSEEQRAFGRELTTEEWLKLGKDAIDKGMIYLLLTGGEPMLRPDFIELYTKLVEMGLMISINTNGTLISPAIIECFQKHRPEKVNITLYGMCDGTYSNLCGNDKAFEKAVQGIKMLKAAGIPVSLNTTFTRLNVADMSKIVAFAKEQQIPVRMAAFLFPPVRNGHLAEQEIYLTPEEMGKASAMFEFLTMDAEQFQKRKEMIRKCLSQSESEEKPVSKKLACMAGRGSFWISWNGKMYPCGMLSEHQQDVMVHSFQEAWANIVADTGEIYLPKECSVCKYSKICSACAAVTETVNGVSDMVAMELCERTKIYAEEILRL